MMSRLKRPWGNRISALTGRYLFRLVIVLCSLSIYSWAIAAFIPAHQTNSHQTRLSVSDLSLNFVAPAPVQSNLKQTSHKVSQSTTNQQARATPPAQRHAARNPVEAAALIKPEAPVERPRQTVSVRHEASTDMKQVSQPSDPDTPAHQPDPTFLTETLHTETSATDTSTRETSPSAPSLSVNETRTNPLVSNPAFSSPPKQPRYPTIARKRGQEGVVWLEVWLDKTGEQTDLRVTESSGVSSLDHAAIRAVKQWQFEPHRHKSLAIASRVKIPIEFVLN